MTDKICPTVLSRLGQVSAKTMPVETRRIVLTLLTVHISSVNENRFYIHSNAIIRPYLCHDVEIIIIDYPSIEGQSKQT